jgi:hypothetical protein
MNRSDDNALRRAGQRGGLMHMVAHGLSAQGFDIRYPECEDGRRLTFAGLHGVRCWVSVGDYGQVEWECFGWAADEADPWKIADLAASLLAGRSVDCPRGDDRELPAHVPLKGIVGRQLKASGLDVCLQVYEDQNFYDVLAEIVVTNPDARDDATVRVTDDGAVTWERDFWPEAVTITSCDEPSPLEGTGEVARSIVDAVTLAVSRPVPPHTAA